jgi:O-methyltransferase
MSSTRPIRGWATAAVRNAVKTIFHFFGLEVIKTSTLLAFERTLAEDATQIAELQATLTQNQARIVADTTQVVKLQATLTESQAQIAQLKQQSSNDAARIQDLTDIAAEYQLKLERKPDYQVIMAQDQLRAGMANLEPEFLEVYVKCREYTMTSWERLYALYKAIHYLVDNRIPGDIVECGVWRGGSMRLAAMTLLSLGTKDRTLYLYDTFEGMIAPDGELDLDLHGNRAIDDWAQITRRGVKWSYAPIEEVRQNIETTGYPMDRVELVKGPVELTIPDVKPQRIALLRLDTDWYKSTKHEIEQLYPLLSPGGVLALDDYGHYQGARRAIDEYFAGLAKKPFLQRTDYACRFALKPQT